MPETYWLPLEIGSPVEADHLHAAFTRWFDAEEGESDPRKVPHGAIAKPYSLSMVGKLDGTPGISVSVLSDDARGLFLERAAAGAPVRLGRQIVRTGRPRLTASASWGQLAGARYSTQWEVEFQTPTVFRTSGRPSILPTPSVVLRSPLEAWTAWSGVPLLAYDPVAVARSVRVEWAQISTVPVMAGRKSVPGMVGRVRYVSDDADVARGVSLLLGVAGFSGVGSYTARGLGTVEVTLVGTASTGRARERGSGRGAAGEATLSDVAAMG